MNIGIYKSASAMVGCDRWQEMISKNLSSASVPGFRKSEAAFEAKASGMERYGSGASDEAKEAKASVPTIGSQISMQPGEIRVTGNDTDFAIQGRGFFKVQLDDQKSGYTRDGEFHLDAKRTLVNKAGKPVLSESGPIVLRPDGGKLSISGDGTIVQGETPLGKLPIYNFPDSEELMRIGDGLLTPKNEEVAPAKMDKPEIVGGMLEMSNVQPLQEMVNMITVSRAYEANQRVITSQDELLGKAIQTLGSLSA
jgi:flagellar basal-body rod protein FlgF